MASIPGTAEKFDMGRVFSRAAGAIQRNQTVFIGLALLLGFAPAVVVTMLTAVSPISGVAFAFGTIVTSYVMMAAMTHATIVDLRNGRASFGECMAKGGQMILPLIGLGIVQTFGLMFAFLLLIIPGLILAVMWSVALPVLVGENPGVFASLSRSSELTKGSRWSIFAMLLIAGVMILVPLVLLPLLTGAFDDPTAVQQLSIAGIFTQLLGALASMLVYAGLAATYIELRYVKEGSSADSLAAIFD